MRVLLIILALTTSCLTYGQRQTKHYTYKSFPELTLPAHIDATSLPKYFTSAGSGSGWTLKLEKDGRFEFIENVDCTESISIAKGKWTIHGNNLVLKAPKFKKTFKVVVFSNYSFVIDKTEREKFLRAFEALQLQFSSEPSILKYEYIYLRLQDDYLNKRVRIASS